MGLFGLFGGDSSSSSSTTNSDRRNANDNGSVGVSGDSNTLTVTNTTNNTTTDSGAVSQGIGLANTAVTGGQKTVDRALEISRESTAWGLEAGYQSLLFADKQGGLAIGTVERIAGDSIKAAYGGLDAALKANGTVTGDAFKLVGDTVKDSYAFAWQNSSEALGLGRHVVDIATQQAKDTKDAYATATDMVAKSWVAASDFHVEKVTADARYMVIALVGIVAVLAFNKKG